MRKGRGEIHHRRGGIPDAVSISERTVEADSQLAAGYLEGRSNDRKKHKSALAIFVEKVARLTTFIPVKRKDAKEVERSVCRGL